MNNLEYVENKFGTLNETGKKITLGKLHILETLVEMLNTMRESLTRELVVNGVEKEEDILNAPCKGSTNNEGTKKEEEKITYNIEDFD